MSIGGPHEVLPPHGCTTVNTSREDDLTPWTTDRHPAYRRAIRWILGRKAQHRTAQYLNNYTEQSHRAVKQRYYRCSASETSSQRRDSVPPSMSCVSTSAFAVGATRTSR